MTELNLILNLWQYIFLLSFLFNFKTLLINIFLAVLLAQVGKNTANYTRVFFKKGIVRIFEQVFQCYGTVRVLFFRSLREYTFTDQ